MLELAIQNRIKILKMDMRKQGSDEVKALTPEHLGK